jgi:hypothetical protein
MNEWQCRFFKADGANANSTDSEGRAVLLSSFMRTKGESDGG